ncbi:MAG: hypothetical protein HYS98_01400, partial [Deltaproteobacteria bacterium]|nr:hypothetical protein [Deltaproteobacteria bacterium]
MVHFVSFLILLSFSLPILAENGSVDAPLTLEYSSSNLESLKNEIESLNQNPASNALLIENNIDSAMKILQEEPPFLFVEIGLDSWVDAKSYFMRLAINLKKSGFLGIDRPFKTLDVKEDFLWLKKNIYQIIMHPEAIKILGTLAGHYFEKADFSKALYFYNIQNQLLLNRKDIEKNKQNILTTSEYLGIKSNEKRFVPQDVSVEEIHLNSEGSSITLSKSSEINLPFLSQGSWEYKLQDIHVSKNYVFLNFSIPHPSKPGETSEEVLWVLDQHHQLYQELLLFQSQPGFFLSKPYLDPTEHFVYFTTSEKNGLYLYQYQLTPFQFIKKIYLGTTLRKVNDSKSCDIIVFKNKLVVNNQNGTLFILDSDLESASAYVYNTSSKQDSNPDNDVYYYTYDEGDALTKWQGHLIIHPRNFSRILSFDIIQTSGIEILQTVHNDVTAFDQILGTYNDILYIYHPALAQVGGYQWLDDTKLIMTQKIHLPAWVENIKLNGAKLIYNIKNKLFMYSLDDKDLSQTKIYLFEGTNESLMDSIVTENEIYLKEVKKVKIYDFQQTSQGPDPFKLVSSLSTDEEKLKYLLMQCNAPSKNVRYQASQKILNLGYATIPTLLTLSKKEHAFSVRSLLQNYLEKTLDQEFFEFQSGDYPFLWALLEWGFENYTDPNSQWKILETLKNLLPNRNGIHLIEKALTSSNYTLQRTALKCLFVQSHEQELHDDILQMLQRIYPKPENITHREIIYLLCFIIAKEKALPYLQMLAGSTNEETQRLIQYVLEPGTWDCKEFLESKIFEKDLVGSETAVILLALQKDESVHQFIFSRWTDLRKKLGYVLSPKLLDIIFSDKRKIPLAMSRYQFLLERIKDVHEQAEIRAQALLHLLSKSLWEKLTQEQKDEVMEALDQNVDSFNLLSSLNQLNIEEILKALSPIHHTAVSSFIYNFFSKGVHSDINLAHVVLALAHRETIEKIQVWIIEQEPKKKDNVLYLKTLLGDKKPFYDHPSEGLLKVLIESPLTSLSKEEKREILYSTLLNITSSHLKWRALIYLVDPATWVELNADHKEKIIDYVLTHFGSFPYFTPIAMPALFVQTKDTQFIPLLVHLTLISATYNKVEPALGLMHLGYNKNESLDLKTDARSDLYLAMARLDRNTFERVMNDWSRYRSESFIKLILADENTALSIMEKMDFAQIRLHDPHESSINKTEAAKSVLTQYWNQLSKDEQNAS